MSNIASISAILKEFYLGPIAEQLNQECLAYQMFEKATVEYTGKHVIIPVHVERNNSVTWVADDGTLPNAGSEVFRDLTCTAKFLYGRFAITGPAMAAAKKSGVGAFVSWSQAEMDRLVEDVKVGANKACIFGGRVLGYIFGEANSATHAYSGRQTADGLSLNTATSLVDVVRMDTYATVASNARINSISPTAVVFNAAVDTTGLSLGELGVFALVATTTSTVVGAAAGAWAYECEGITTNLSTPSHFGVDRTTATGYEILQSNHYKVSSVNATGYAALTTDALQKLLDKILDKSDKTPNVILMNALMRQEYTSLLVGTSAGNYFVNVKDAPSKADGGFTDFGYAGIPMKTSQAVFKGTMFFLSTAEWNLLELAAPNFADDDGAVLSRVPNQDKFEGYFRSYFSIVCKRPNAQGVLTGVSFT
jgi:hypothetical protein